MIRQLKGLDLNKACLISVTYANRTLLDSKEKPYESVRISSRRDP